MKAILIPVAAAVLALAAARGPNQYEHVSADTRTSHDGRYHVSAEPIDGDSWTVHVSNRNGVAVSDAQVYAYATMPETGRATSVHIRAARAGTGKYSVDGLKLDQAGWWNIALIIASPMGTDSAAFNVTIR